MTKLHVAHLRGGDVVVPVGEAPSLAPRVVVAYDAHDRTVTLAGETKWISARAWRVVGDARPR